mgnify:CR=1 FL=1
MFRPRSLAIALGALVASLSGEASANGRYPAAQHVLVGPGASSSLVVLRNTFGFLRSTDGGASFGWICEGALGYGGEFDPSFAIDASGRVHLGLYDGLVRLASDACGVERIAELEGQNVVDLDNLPSGASILALTVTPFVSGGPPPVARVYRSSDAGESYALAGAFDGLLLETLEQAPSSAQRVYLAGGTAPPLRPIALRSDDGGQTAVELEHSWPSDVERLFVAAVDPSDADVVFLRAALKPSSGKSSAIFRSRDGGASFEELLRTDAPALGFAISSDGTQVWVGTPADGLLASNDGGDSFAQVSAESVRCLRHHAGALYVCGGPPKSPPMLGRSLDGGATVESLVSSCALDGALGCVAPSSPVEVCAGFWPQVGSILPCIEPGEGGGSPAGSTSSSGGAAASSSSSGAGTGGEEPSAEGSSDGCACSLGARRTTAPGSALALLAAFALAWRRRARRFAVRSTPTDADARTSVSTWSLRTSTPKLLRGQVPSSTAKVSVASE